MVRVLLELPLGADAWLLHLAVLPLALLLGLLDLRAEGGHLVLLFGGHRRGRAVLLPVVLGVVDRSAVEALHSVLLALRLLHRASLFQVALAATARHDIYALHRGGELMLEVGDLVLQLLEMVGLESGVRIGGRHLVHLGLRWELELVLHRLGRALAALLIIERFGRLVLHLFALVLLVVLAVFLILLAELLLFFVFQLLFLLNLCTR